MLRYGAMLDTGKPLRDVLDEARHLAGNGFMSLSVSHIFGYDALTLVQLIGADVEGVELITGVVPIYTRHPIAMAQQALTVQSATGGRLTLGIGLSHAVVVEQIYGLSYSRPLSAMREYLSVLVPLLRCEHVEYSGETLSVNAGPLEVDAPAPPVIVAALQTAMLELAGELADGTATWLTGLETLASHTVPTIRAAAERAGRPAPRVLAGLPVSVTADPESVRQLVDRVFAGYGQLPSYRAMLDREGATSPGDVALVGDEDGVRAMLQRMEESGVTDLLAAPVGSPEEISRTIGLFGELSSGH